MNITSDSISLVTLGYKDYIAARHLINCNYIIQGVTLASTAIEKYIKFVLVSHGVHKKDMRVHLDKIGKLKKLLTNCYYDFTIDIDPVFLKILGESYKIRYYDDLDSPLSFGFFVNQFIGELDFAINLFETSIIESIQDDKGNLIETMYNRDIKAKNKDLYLNNYILNGLRKQQQMELKGSVYGIYINNKDTIGGAIVINAENVMWPYDGSMWDMNFSQTIE